MEGKSSKSSGRSGRLWGIGLILVAVVGGYLNYRQQLSCTSVTSGTVVEVRQKRVTERVDSKTKRTMKYSPVYEFRAGDKVVRQTDGSSSEKRNEFIVGKRVTICYNPSDPETFYVKGTENDYIVLCGFLAFLGIVVFYLESRKRKVNSSSGGRPC